MQKFIKYLLIFSMGISMTVAGNRAGFASDSSTGAFPSPAFNNLKPFYQEILRQVAERSADLVYDYDTRPLIRTAIMDFPDQSGQEIAVGNDLSAYLRSGLDRENQFYIYGREQIRRSLGHFIQVNREMKPYLVSRLQELVQIVFKKPIHLIIAGEIRKTDENQLQINVTIIPFFQPLKPVEMEAERLSFPQLSFLSSKMTDEEIKQALAKPKSQKGLAINPGYGRLIVLSNYLLEKPREQERRYLGTLEATRPSYEKEQGSSLRQLNLGDPQDLTSWLDKQELFIFEERQIGNFKDYYYNILSGFGADHIWFDAEVKEGDHQLAFSVFPVNTLNKKAVSYPFRLTPGTTTYLVVTVVSQPQKDPDVKIRMIEDPDNRVYPF
jgi:hypothetical protein